MCVYYSTYMERTNTGGCCGKETSVDLDDWVLYLACSFYRARDPEILVET